MKTHHALGVGVAVLSGFTAAAATIGGLLAQAKPPAYVIIDISKTSDADAYIKAVSAAEPNATLSAGGRFIIRSNSAVGLDGASPPNRFVVIAFDSEEKAKAWYRSPAITKVNAVRMKATESRAFMVDGLAK